MDFIRYLKDNFNIGLNAQQQKAVLHKDGPAIVLAVPGAGKTTALICRTANLIINYNISPENILSVTFSKAAASDMKHRFNSIFGRFCSEEVHFSTIHSFAYSLLRHYYRMCKKELPNILEDEKSKINKAGLLKQIFFEVNNAYINDDKLEELSNAIGFVKNSMIEMKDVKKHEFNIANFEEILKRYESAKAKNNYIDFDDMLTYSLAILENEATLLKMYRNRFKYIQVDEAQDTSKIQHKIIKLLSNPLNNLFMVADDDQSIYGFRGAYPKALLEFEKEYNGAKVFFMEENYRSSKDIVETADKFIKKNSERYAKNLFTQKEYDRPVNIVSLKDEKEQYLYILQNLKSTTNYSDTAILYRTNISAIPLVDILHRNDIPFYLKDYKLNFFNHWLTQDIAAFLNLGLDDRNVSAFARIYYKMNGYISKAMLEFLQNSKYAFKKSVFDILLTYPEVKGRKIDTLMRLKHSFESLAKKKPYDAIKYIERDLNYSEYLERSSSTMGYSNENINTVLSNLKIIAKGSNSIIEYLVRIQELQGIMDAAKFNRHSNAVTLSTIHSAKGLEFEKVYMIDLIDRQFPSAGSIDDYMRGMRTELEEERRLFYVGMTRAKKHLDLIYVKEKNGESFTRSRFIDDVDIAVNGEVMKENYTNGYKAGMVIIHEHYGVGEILSIDVPIVEIEFTKYGRKKLSLDICIENNLIREVKVV